MPEGLVGITKVGENEYRIGIGTSPPPGNHIAYELRFVADDFQNVEEYPFDTEHRGPDYPEWPPTPLGGREYVLQGAGGGKYGDSLIASGLSKVSVSLWKTEGNTPEWTGANPLPLLPHFTVLYLDRTAEGAEEQELVSKVTEATVVKKNRGWQFALGFGGGGGTITGATTKSLWKSLIGTIIPAGIGYGIGSQLEYWGVEHAGEAIREQMI